MIDRRLKFAFAQLVLAKSCSVEAAARRYDCDPRTVRRWCRLVPISCKIAHGGRRISLPLLDVYALAGESRALWNLLDGEVAGIVVDAFGYHGASDVLTEYEKKVGQRGQSGHLGVVSAGKGG